MPAMDTIMIVDPAAEEAAKPSLIAPRLASLAGARVGLIDNSKHNAETFLQEVESLLRTCYGVQTFSHYRKSNPSIPTPPEILAGFVASCDAVIHGVAD